MRARLAGALGRCAPAPMLPRSPARRSEGSDGSCRSGSGGGARRPALASPSRCLPPVTSSAALLRRGGEHPPEGNALDVDVAEARALEGRMQLPSTELRRVEIAAAESLVSGDRLERRALQDPQRRKSVVRRGEEQG